MIGCRRQTEPAMPRFLPYRCSGRWEIRVGESADSDAAELRCTVSLPKDIAAAIRAEMETVLEAAIRLFWKRGGDRLSSLLGD